ncbi:hypothetical protein C8Q75DRAFT_811932 [Abortiporus biennis]|nr:hypothetical protein C8Q75DRAFT_811932 [Abortiporus biennis]
MLHHSLYTPRRDPAKWEGIRKQDPYGSIIPYSEVDRHSTLSYNSIERDGWKVEHPSPKYSVLPDPVADNINFDPHNDMPPSYSRRASMHTPTISQHRSQSSHSFRSHVTYGNAKRGFADYQDFYRQFNLVKKSAPRFSYACREIIIVFPAAVIARSTSQEYQCIVSMSSSHSGDNP